MMASVRTTLYIAPLLLLLGCSNTSSAPTGVQQSARPASGLIDSHPTVVGKWHRKFVDQIDRTCSSNLEFFASGDFSMATLTPHAMSGPSWDTSAGTYKFIDSSHLKLDYGLGSEMYELVSVSDKELRLKHGGEVEVWTTGFGPPPTS